MGLLDFLRGTRGGSTAHDIDPELKEFTAKRKYERKEVETALNNWIMKTGLWEIFLDQMDEEYELSEYQHKYMRGAEFDPRRPECQEIIEFVENAENTIGDRHVSSFEWENDLEPYEDQQQKIYQELQTRGALTDEELMHTFDEMDAQIRNAAISRLNDKGKIRPVTIAGRDGYKARGRK